MHPKSPLDRADRVNFPSWDDAFSPPPAPDADGFSSVESVVADALFGADTASNHRRPSEPAPAALEPASPPPRPSIEDDEMICQAFFEMLDLNRGRSHGVMQASSPAVDLRSPERPPQAYLDRLPANLFDEPPSPAEGMAAMYRHYVLGHVREAFGIPRSPIQTAAVDPPLDALLASPGSLSLDELSTAGPMAAPAIGSPSTPRDAPAKQPHRVRPTLGESVVHPSPGLSPIAGQPRDPLLDAHDASTPPNQQPVGHTSRDLSFGLDFDSAPDASSVAGTGSSGSASKSMSRRASGSSKRMLFSDDTIVLQGGGGDDSQDDGFVEAAEPAGPTALTLAPLDLALVCSNGAADNLETPKLTVAVQSSSCQQTLPTVVEADDNEEEEEAFTFVDASQAHRDRAASPSLFTPPNYAASHRHVPATDPIRHRPASPSTPYAFPATESKLFDAQRQWRQEPETPMRLIGRSVINGSPYTYRRAEPTVATPSSPHARRNASHVGDSTFLDQDPRATLGAASALQSHLRTRLPLSTLLLHLANRRGGSTDG